MAALISLEYQKMLERIKEKSKQNNKERITQKIPEDGIYCDKCNNTGMVCVTEENGHEYMIPCSECYAKREVARRLKASGISTNDYARYTLESFDENRNKESADIKKLAEKFLSEHKKNGKGFGIFGSSGVGKTHICIAVCQELTKRFKEPHYYFSYRAEMPSLIKCLRSYQEEYEDKLYKWKTRQNLYIDDLFKCAGRTQQIADKNFVSAKLISIDNDDLRIMYDILNARYLNHLTTLFSSEYSVNDISKIDTALGSRIYEMIEPYGLTVHGRNQRLTRVKNENS